MAFSLNRAQVIGNVTRDPEVKNIASGQTVASFAVATNSSWTDKMGAKQEKSEFHNIVAWGKLAEICQAYVKKGRKLYVEGRMQTRDWEGEDGVKRYRSEIVAENLILLDRSGAPEGGVTYDREQAPDAFKPQKQEAAAPEVEEVTLDDLPF